MPYLASFTHKHGHGPDFTVRASTGLGSGSMPMSPQYYQYQPSVRYAGDAALFNNDPNSSSTKTIGKISLDLTQVLGRGSDGTFVYRGTFDRRPVAVKRVLTQCYDYVETEVATLLESDQHDNIIRYFYSEVDTEFRYIALELCTATLGDWVEGRCELEGVDELKILKEVTGGLGYLHSLGIVHRDVKPGNVLLKEGQWGDGEIVVKAMLSDFGLSKKIQMGRESYTRSGIRGTDGWIAPEVILGGEATRMTSAVDIFSLGCLYHYVLTKGSHPFGDIQRRQGNIIDRKVDLSRIEDHPRGAAWLIRLMTFREPKFRPPIRAVLAHPLLWSSKRVLGFLKLVSDCFEGDRFRNQMISLEEVADHILEGVGGNWSSMISPEVFRQLSQFRKYDGHSIRHLLRAIRNSKEHYYEMSAEAKGEFGEMPDGFIHFWLDRFPILLPCIWLTFEGQKRETVFEKYYNYHSLYRWNSLVSKLCIK